MIFLNRKKNQNKINFFLDEIGLVFEKITVKESSISGKKIVITGTFPLARRILKEKLQSLGAEIVSSLSKSTDYLLVGESAGSKLKKAKELEVSLIDAEQLKKILEKNGLGV